MEAPVYHTHGGRINMLEIKNLTKKYGDFTALDHINITLNKGIYGLLGANGAGKSTLMNLITDNLKRTSGDILYNGRDILELGSAYRKKIGYTPQLQGMYEDFSARDFLHYIGTLKGMKRKECKQQTEEFLEIVGLAKKAHKSLGSYSGGMRQRVLLAAAMLDNPEILILDEPTAGLDPEERIRLCNYISGLAKERTVILATHIVSDIEAMANTVLLMSRGRIVVSGSPVDVIAEINSRIYEFYGNYEEVMTKKALFPKGQISQNRNGYILRIVADVHPEDFVTVTGTASLEDVYLYYAEGRV